MSYNPFKLQFGKDKKVTQEGIVVIDAVGQVHSLCWDPSNEASKLIHTVVQLHQNIDYFKEDNWNNFYMSPKALVFKQKIYNMATGNEENKHEYEADQEGQDAVTINGSTMLIQMNITESSYRFSLRPSPGSRQLNLLPIKLQHEIHSMLFTSMNSVVIHMKSKQLLHFKADGSLMKQEDDWFNRAEYVLCQSEQSSESKYVAYYCNGFSVVKYDREGFGTRVSRFYLLAAIDQIKSVWKQSLEDSKKGYTQEEVEEMADVYR